MQNKFEDIEDAVTESGAWETFVEFLNLGFQFGSEASPINISVGLLVLIIIIYLLTTIVLNFLHRLYAKRLPQADKAKFNTVFSFARWLIYLVVILVVFDSVGVNVTAIFAASAALLIGVGLALQTFFQDILSGVFILVDQSLHVGDIIEIEGKVGRVEEIKLRTTRAVTIDNRVLVIPNHLYLTNSLYNWTQNDISTRENITVGVAYGSDTQLVKRLLLEAANSHPEVLDDTSTVVLFTDFGDSSLIFKVVFTVRDSFKSQFPKSDIRFEIDRLFRENNVSIPFPQRDIHIIEKKSK
ncbi:MULTISPECIES: mechanosensitive ion channel family protein [Bizionia]|uniref:Mechanosensitive ion channel n=1 Tax=Bizionia algoritergicola TaxID=291187 RepID=A0A5D0QUC9_9FLAO|nr:MULTISPECIES: mechanosensitive ion channel domain-containing protein [Bizionia]OBX21593.1 mechanosensitive ion channel protein MscS [Bizionia sp. APA-3]TYB72038.1 mechanosensitive ion channel [Bizionia algoritergicola]